MAYKKAIYEELYPEREKNWTYVPKTLIFAKDDNHASEIVEGVKDVFYTQENYSEEFTIGDDGGVISEIPLDGKEYQYVFVATDIYGNTFTSDMTTFKMTVSYNELLNNPLSDGTFAAKITNIEPFVQ